MDLEVAESLVPYPLSFIFERLPILANSSSATLLFSNQSRDVLNFLSYAEYKLIFLYTMAPTNKKRSPDNAQRYKSNTRKLLTTISRRRWRTLNKSTYRRTALEKANLKAKRQTRNKELNAAIEEARIHISDDARNLREKFGGHSEQYYFEQIIQASRIQKSQRKVNRFNAYAREETKQINEGKLYSQIVFKILFLSYRLARWPTSKSHSAHWRHFSQVE